MFQARLRAVARFDDGFGRGQNLVGRQPSRGSGTRNCLTDRRLPPRAPAQRNSLSRLSVSWPSSFPSAVTTVRHATGAQPEAFMQSRRDHGRAPVQKSDNVARLDFHRGQG